MQVPLTFKLQMQSIFLQVKLTTIATFPFGIYSKTDTVDVPAWIVIWTYLILSISDNTHEFFQSEVMFPQLKTSISDTSLSLSTPLGFLDCTCFVLGSKS